MMDWITAKIFARTKSNDVTSQKNAIVNSGDNSTQQVAGRDININNFALENENVIADAESWKILEKFFSDQGASKMIDDLTNPLAQQNFKSVFNGQRKFIRKRFESVRAHPKNKKEICEIYESADKAIVSFAETRDKEKFKQEWRFCRDELKKLKENSIE